MTCDNCVKLECDLAAAQAKLDAIGEVVDACCSDCGKLTEDQCRKLECPSQAIWDVLEDIGCSALDALLEQASEEFLVNLISHGTCPYCLACDETSGHTGTSMDVNWQEC